MRREWITIAVLFSTAVGVWACFRFGIKSDSPLSFAINIITLGVVILYVHYTYRLHRANWIPVGTFKLKQDKDDPYLINTYLKNFTKLQDIYMWINLNPTVNGKKVIMDSKVYSGKEPWPLQPLQPGEGKFRIDRDILNKVEDASIDAMKRVVTNENYKNQLRFSIEIKVVGVHTGLSQTYAKREYFYDFRGGQQKLVLDPGFPHLVDE